MFFCHTLKAVLFRITPVFSVSLMDLPLSVLGVSFTHAWLAPFHS